MSHLYDSNELMVSTWFVDTLKYNLNVFEQVGGPFSSVALQQMKHFGRIAVCGGISLYNDQELQTGLSTLRAKFRCDLALINLQYT